jgi:hypothetical protein
VKGEADGRSAGQENTYFLMDPEFYYQAQKNVPPYPQSSPRSKGDTLGPGSDVSHVM